MIPLSGHSLKDEIRRAILIEAAKAPLLERDIPTRVGFYPRECSDAMAYLVALGYLTATGLRWRVSDAGRDAAGAAGFTLPDPVATPALESAPLRQAGTTRKPRVPAPRKATPKPAGAKPAPFVAPVPRSPSGVAMQWRREILTLLAPSRALRAATLADELPSHLVVPASGRKQAVANHLRRAESAGLVRSERRHWMLTTEGARVAATYYGLTDARPAERIPDEPSREISEKARYHRDLRRRKAEAKAAGVPFVPHKPPPIENPSPATIHWRKMRDRRLARAAGLPVEPLKPGRKPIENPAPSTVKWRARRDRRQADDLAARCEAMTDTIERVP